MRWITCPSGSKTTATFAPAVPLSYTTQYTANLDTSIKAGDGTPLASAVSLVSFQRGTPKDAVYVRKEAKDHGSKRDLEGNTRLAPGARLVIMDGIGHFPMIENYPAFRTFLLPELEWMS